MEWLVGLAGLWVLLQWIIPLALLVVIAVVAMRFARARNRKETPTFSSTMPEDREYQERYWPLEPDAASDREAHLHVRGRHR